MKINRIPWMPEPIEVSLKRPRSGCGDEYDVQIQYWRKRDDNNGTFAGNVAERCPVCGSGEEMGTIRCCLVDTAGLDHTYCRYPCGSCVATFHDGAIAAAYVSDTCYGIMSVTNTQEDII